MSKKDYSDFGVTIRTAMVEDAKRFPRESVSDNYIYWADKEIRTSLLVTPPWGEGFIKLTFLKRDGATSQGVDIKIEDGTLISTEGKRFKTLRTWASDEYEDEVEYRYVSPRKAIWIWNVYEIAYGDGRVVEEKWTENAGFWVEQTEPSSYIFHCSNGVVAPPNFESLVFRIDLRT